MKEFKSFGAFAAHLERSALLGEVVTHEITVKAAQLIQRDAQDRLGIYQDRTGNFNAWAPLAESTKADRIAKGYPADEPLLREGILRDSIEVAAHADSAVIGSDDDVALYQELGTEHIPPRAFLGPAAYDSRTAIGEMAANVVVAWVSGNGWHRPQRLVRIV